MDLTGIDALTDLTTLDLSDNAIVDVTALESLTNLTSLDLTGNGEVLCSDLGDLEVTLGAGVVTRPVPCNTGGGVIPQPVQNLHNAQGQRAVKTVNGDPSTAIHFIYDQAGRVIAEIDASTGQTLREYVYVNGMQIALVDDTGTQDEAVYFVHNDHLGTPQKITDATQTVVWAGSYEPFGEVVETVAVIENNVRFPGQYEDGESGLYYNYFRDYDPSIGRYVESDPIGILGGTNTYIYAESEPIGLLDPTGLNYIESFMNGWFQQQIKSDVANAVAAAKSGIAKIRCVIKCYVVDQLPGAGGFKMAELAAKAAGARALAKQIPVIGHTWVVLGTPGVLAQCEEICEKDCYQ